MAKNIINLYHLTPTLLFIFLTICMFQSSILCRPLFGDGFEPNNLSATQPALNLVLPGDDNSVISVSLAKKNCGSEKNVVACDVMDSKNNFNVESKGELKKKLEGKYGPLILNSLPKGVPVPPSGPSKRTNRMDMN